MDTPDPYTEQIPPGFRRINHLDGLSELLSFSILNCLFHHAGLPYLPYIVLLYAHPQALPDAGALH